LLLEQILFFLAAAGALGGALGVVVLRNPFYSVLALVAHLFALAILFLLLRAEFLAAAQVVVYAGAVMVLYVFVVAYVGGVEEETPVRARAVTTLGPLFAGALLAELTIAIVGTGLGALDSRGPDVATGFGSPGAVGELLLEKFLIPFELSSLLLLVAAVGAVMLARRRRGLEEIEGDELPERAGRYPLGGRDPEADLAGAGPIPSTTAEAPADPTVERGESEKEPVRGS
jgi:NADH-quinone oxidoreductase subunit J